MGDSKKLVCDQESMWGYYIMLADIWKNLDDIHQKAAGLAADFDNCYMGDARDEVMTFLENLPLHIYRLEIFYNKLMDYIAITAQTALYNDVTMARKMEGYGNGTN